MYTFRKLVFWISLIVLLTLLGACNTKKATPTQVSPDAAHTAAWLTVTAGLRDQNGPNATSTAIAATVIAQVRLTQAASTGQPQVATSTPTATPQPATATNTSVPSTPTNTPIPPTPTNTSIPPTPTNTPIPCDLAKFVKDVTYDDTQSVPEVQAEAAIVKTWRLKNNGSCTWNSNYSLVFDHGEAMNGPAAQQLTTSNVAPGQEIDVSVTLKAPKNAGTYQGFWKLRNGSGVVFGIGKDGQSAFWVKIKVITATPVPAASGTYDFFANAQKAEWRNGTSTTLLPWGDQIDDMPGSVGYGESDILEDNLTHAKALFTIPQIVDNGKITGVYPPFLVANGNHFKAQIGFYKDCTGSNVKFRLGYKEGSTVTFTDEWTKTCDGSLWSLDVDLSGLKGKTVQFILEVTTNGSFNKDYAYWIAPRIE
jgi:hypothetical protein